MSTSPFDDHTYDIVEHVDDFFIITWAVECFGMDGEPLPIADFAVVLRSHGA